MEGKWGVLCFNRKFQLTYLIFHYVNKLVLSNSSFKSVDKPVYFFLYVYSISHGAQTFGKNNHIRKKCVQLKYVFDPQYVVY